HEIYGEEVGLVVETDDIEPIRERLDDALASLPVRMRPKVTLWGAEVISRTHTGKTQRRMLVPRFAEYERRSMSGTVAHIPAAPTNA
ncbi:MAG TPA: hypothetical protein VN408_40770, partial [Actinoplanes sp.]|nr:hypothetical protein [Actinoplanes sp.]